MNFKLFWLYLVFYLAGRLYMLVPANSQYIFVKIVHSVGLHFCIVALIACLIHFTAGRVKFFFIIFMIYEIIAMITFCFVQFGMDQEVAAHMWEIGAKSPAVFNMSIMFGIAQDLFIPAIALYVFIKVSET